MAIIFADDMDASLLASNPHADTESIDVLLATVPLGEAGEAEEDAEDAEEILRRQDEKNKRLEEHLERKDLRAKRKDEEDARRKQEREEMWQAREDEERIHLLSVSEKKRPAEQLRLARQKKIEEARLLEEDQRLDDRYLEQEREFEEERKAVEKEIEDEYTQRDKKTQAERTLKQSKASARQRLRDAQRYGEEGKQNQRIREEEAAIHRQRAAEDAKIEKDWEEEQAAVAWIFKSQEYKANRAEEVQQMKDDLAAARAEEDARRMEKEEDARKEREVERQKQWAHEDVQREQRELEEYLRTKPKRPRPFWSIPARRVLAALQDGSAVEPPPYVDPSEWTDPSSGLKRRLRWKNGFVRHDLPDGSVYLGNMYDGLPHGEGRLIWAGGRTTYVGQWRLGEPHGDGVARAGGWIYSGQFVHGLRHGIGRVEFHTEHCSWYDGDWENGLQEGLGECGSENRPYIRKMAHDPLEPPPADIFHMVKGHRRESASVSIVAPTDDTEPLMGVVLHRTTLPTKNVKTEETRKKEAKRRQELVAARGRQGRMTSAARIAKDLLGFRTTPEPVLDDGLQVECPRLGFAFGHPDVWLPSRWGALIITRVYEDGPLDLWNKGQLRDFSDVALKVLPNAHIWRVDGVEGDAHALATALMSGQAKKCVIEVWNPAHYRYAHLREGYSRRAGFFKESAFAKEGYRPWLSGVQATEDPRNAHEENVRWDPAFRQPEAEKKAVSPLKELPTLPAPARVVASIQATPHSGYAVTSCPPTAALRSSASESDRADSLALADEPPPLALLGPRPASEASGSTAEGSAASQARTSESSEVHEDVRRRVYVERRGEVPGAPTSVRMPVPPPPPRKLVVQILNRPSPQKDTTAGRPLWPAAPRPPAGRMMTAAEADRTEARRPRRPSRNEPETPPGTPPLEAFGADPVVFQRVASRMEMQTIRGNAAEHIVAVEPRDQGSDEQPGADEDASRVRDETWCPDGEPIDTSDPATTKPENTPVAAEPVQDPATAGSAQGRRRVRVVEEEESWCPDGEPVAVFAPDVDPNKGPPAEEETWCPHGEPVEDTSLAATPAESTPADASGSGAAAADPATQTYPPPEFLPGSVAEIDATAAASEAPG